jgi:hypothetical protein
MINETEEGKKMLKDKRKPQDAPKDEMATCHNNYRQFLALKRAAANNLGAANRLNSASINHNAVRETNDRSIHKNKPYLSIGENDRRNERIQGSANNVASRRNMTTSTSSGSQNSLVRAGGTYIQAKNVTDV